MGSDANWKYFPNNITETVLTNDQQFHPQEYVYAVSVLKEEGSSSFMWEECVYKKHASKSFTDVHK